MLHLLLAFALNAAASDGLATENDYKIVSEGTKLKAGKEGTLTVSIVALNGFKVSQETPFSLKLSAPDALTLGATQFQRKDLVDPQAKDPKLKTTVLAKTKGEHTVKSDAVFFLCSDKLCQRMAVKNDLKLTVE